MLLQVVVLEGLGIAAVFGATGGVAHVADRGPAGVFVHQAFELAAMTEPENLADWFEDQTLTVSILDELNRSSAKYIISEHEDEFRRVDLLHFLPALLILINRLPYYFTNPGLKSAFRAGNREVAQQIHWPFVPLFSVQDYLFMLHLSAYAVLCFWYLRRNGFWRAAGEEDDMAMIRRKWSRTLLWLYTGFLLGNVTYYVLIRTPFFSIEWDYGISLAMTVFIYVVGYLGYRQPEAFAGELWPQAFLAPKYQNSSLTPSASRSLLDRVREYVEQEKPYLDNELRLSGLADQLDVSIHHLSQVINEQLGKSFSDFINEYRVEEAKRLMANPRYKERYVISIAYEAGFNNKTSFNKAFKVQTGLSPSQYRKKKLAKVAAESRSDG